MSLLLSVLLAIGLLASQAAAPSEMAQRLQAASLPGRDPFDLAARLRQVSTGPAHLSPPLTLGEEDNFWVLDQRSAQLFQAKAALRLITEHVYWFVQSDLADRAPQADLERSASVFESHTYPVIHQYFGSEPSPGVDGDPRIVMLLANVPGVAAYFSSADAYPREVNPRSNEREMIYINLNALRPGQGAFDSTLVHEFQHMAHFARCPFQEGWVDEGASELAMRVAGYDSGPPLAFANQPGIQLTSWASQPAEMTRHYQAAYLFLRYVAERAGGWEALPRILEPCLRGEAIFAEFLKQTPLAPDVESLVADWAVANLVQDPSAGDGRYSYDNGIFHAHVTGTLGRGSPFQNDIAQYAADYVDLPRDAASANFAGSVESLLFSGAGDGAAWWSNRGDSLDSRLTRKFDLSGVAGAVMRFRAWYDLERQFDFVYLSGSRDGGATWQVLPGIHTEHDQATGNNYGVGWTGSSNGWLDEEVDLSSLVGSSDVLVRFDYVTDQSYNGQGFAIRDVSISSLGIDEPGAPDAAWMSEGWVRVDAPVPQRWNLRLVRWTPAGVVVDPIGVALDGSATFPLDPIATRSTLVIMPTAPRTLVPASYSLTAAD